jgi:hypothetical protein
MLDRLQDERGWPRWSLVLTAQLQYSFDGPDHFQLFGIWGKPRGYRYFISTGESTSLG